MAQAIVDDEVELGARVAGGPVPVLRKGGAEWLFLLPALVFFIGYQVWPIVRARYPDARLTLMGSSPTRRVRALAASASRVAGESWAKCWLARVRLSR